MRAARLRLKQITAWKALAAGLEPWAALEYGYRLALNRINDRRHNARVAREKAAAA